jgi:hypothetical protein
MWDTDGHEEATFMDNGVEDVLVELSLLVSDW